MAKIRGFVSINSRHCKGCELCIYECPQKSLLMSKKLNPKGYHYAFLAEDTSKMYKNVTCRHGQLSKEQLIGAELSGDLIFELEGNELSAVVAELRATQVRALRNRFQRPPTENQT